MSLSRARLLGGVSTAVTAYYLLRAGLHFVLGGLIGGQLLCQWASSFMFLWVGFSLICFVFPIESLLAQKAGSLEWVVTTLEYLFWINQSLSELAHSFRRGSGFRACSNALPILLLSDYSGFLKFLWFLITHTAKFVYKVAKHSWMLVRSTVEGHKLLTWNRWSPGSGRGRYGALRRTSLFRERFIYWWWSSPWRLYRVSKIA